MIALTLSERLAIGAGIGLLAVVAIVAMIGLAIGWLRK